MFFKKLIFHFREKNRFKKMVLDILYNNIKNTPVTMGFFYNQIEKKFNNEQVNQIIDELLTDLLIWRSIDAKGKDHTQIGLCPKGIKTVETWINDKITRWKLMNIFYMGASVCFLLIAYFIPK